MTENDLLEHILDRLGRSDKSEEIFDADEVKRWPAGALGALVEDKLLKQAEPSESIVCDGCEEYCPMPVTVFPADGNCPARAFIFCDKPADLGRIPVSFDRLQQWRIASGFLAKKLSSMFSFDKTPKSENKGKRWTLGILNGIKKKAQVILIVGKPVRLEMAGHEVPLHELLSLRKGALKIDSEEISRLIDKPAEGSRYRASTGRREQRKRQTQERNEIIRESYRELKESQPGEKSEWYSIQIAKDLEEQGYKISPETVRRNLKK